MVLKLILYMKALKVFLLLVFAAAVNEQADVGMLEICFEPSSEVTDFITLFTSQQLLQKCEWHFQCCEMLHSFNKTDLP